MNPAHLFSWAVFFLPLSVVGQLQLPPGSEEQIRKFCRKASLGSVCDLDVNEICKRPQLAWVCGKAAARTTGAPRAGSTPAPRVTRPGRGGRRHFTTRPTAAPVIEKGQPVVTVDRTVGKKFQLTSEQKQQIMGNCAKKAGGCQTQSPEALAVKDKTTDTIAEDLLKGGSVSDPTLARQKAAETVQATQDAKQALYDSQGLTGIEPTDDGLWEKDMRLSLEQAKFIIREVTGENPAPTSLLNANLKGGGRDKRFSIFMESFPTSKWNLPIGYSIGSDLASNEGDQVRRAIAEIQQKTCIKFYEDTNSPPRTPYILYRKYSSGSYCGQSPLGNQNGVNTVWLNYNCDNGNIKATIIHETLHSLGVHHEHVRVDRDDWITVDWNNIDPQSYDLFDGRPYKNSYTSYGVPYDYYSVMHYHAYVAQLDSSRPNMIPKYFPEVFTSKIGQRVGLSDRDAEKLRKMYCMNDCSDYHVWCGYWATENYCLSTQYFSYMRSTCPKSCGFCPGAANN